MGLLKKSVFLILTLFFLFILPGAAHAVQFDLIAPTGTFSRGQNVDFRITVDTEGSSIPSIKIGLSYQSQYLEYVSTSPGNTFTQVSATPQGSDAIHITGSKSPAFSGSGDFATVTFKIIADAPGETELCTLFNPDSAPPPPSTVPPGSTVPPPGTVPPPPGVAPTSPPQITSAVCTPKVTVCACKLGVASCSPSVCMGGLCSNGVCQSCQPGTTAPRSGDTNARNIFIYVAAGLLVATVVFKKLRLKP